MRFRRRRENELNDEIQSHLRMAIQDRIAAGEDPARAREQALREFGNLALTQEVTRQMWRSAWLRAAAGLLQDLRYAVRNLAKSPGFAIVVISILALGIGANTAAFTLLKGAFLKPLPGVHNPTGIVVVAAESTGGRDIPLSYPDYQYLRDHETGLAGLAVSSVRRFNLGLGKRAEQVWGELVSGNYFQVLGVQARLGRTLLPSDELAPGAHPVVVISTGLWQSMFASDPGIVGKTIRINGHPFTIVGVAGPGFQGSMVGMVLDLYVPVMMQPQLSSWGNLLDQRQSQWLVAFGRPRPNLARRAVAARMDVTSAQLAAAFPLKELRQRGRIVPIWRSPFGAQSFLAPVVSLLVATGLLVLLIVCANIANLMLARGVSRRREMAVRLALGAGRSRIVRLLFAESVLLALLGAAAGLFVVVPLLGLLPAGPDVTPFPVDLDVSTDWLVTGFTLLAALGSALLFGLAPSLRSSRMDLVAVMKDEWSLLGSARGRLRGALVVSEVALSLLLLIGAALVTRSLQAARHADVGFDTHNVVSIALDLAPNGYDERRGRTFYDQLMQKAKAQGIESASLAALVPMRLVEGSSTGVAIEGYQPRKTEDMSFGYNLVGPEYFRTLHIPLAAGREFSDLDNQRSPEAAVVNETMARRFWPSVPAAVGRKFRADGKWRTVVGVAKDIKYATLTEAPRPYFYLPYLQDYSPEMTLHVRASTATPHLIDRLRSRVAELDPNLPIVEAQTLEQQVRFALIGYEMTASMLAAFGVLSLGLAAVGTYGMLSYAVRQSTREIGIRAALGASAADVLGQFLRRGATLSLLGIAIGVAGSLGLTKLMASMLYGVASTDVVSFAGASLLVLAVSLAASFVPASRASRVAPMEALRHE